MSKVLYVNTVCQCNKIWGEGTSHPLVSVIDLNTINCKLYESLKVGFYVIVIKEYENRNPAFGHKGCDYSDGSVVFLAPGELLETGSNDVLSASAGRMLVFHPELIHNTCLSVRIHNHTFFNYRNDEALHISQREKAILVRCLENINEELQRPVDKHSRILIAKLIELFLDYCTRFYDRQFITRSEENRALIRKTERIINDYFVDCTTKVKSLPTTKYCAEMLGISPAYFSDLLKWETGQTICEYAESKRIEIAKRWLLKTDKTISRIASDLGYPSPEYFYRLFKKITGNAPDDYKPLN